MLAIKAQRKHTHTHTHFQTARTYSVCTIRERCKKLHGNSYVPAINVYCVKYGT